MGRSLRGFFASAVCLVSLPKNSSACIRTLTFKLYFILCHNYSTRIKTWAYREGRQREKKSNQSLKITFNRQALIVVLVRHLLSKTCRTNIKLVLYIKELLRNFSKMELSFVWLDSSNFLAKRFKSTKEWNFSKSFLFPLTSPTKFLFTPNNTHSLCTLKSLLKLNWLQNMTNT